MTQQEAPKDTQRGRTTVALRWSRDTIAGINSDPAVSYWLKAALADLAHRDPCDALEDCEVLTALMRDRVDTTLRAARTRRPGAER